MRRVIKFPEVEELEREIGHYNQHEWNQDEEEIIKKYYGKMNNKILSKYFGVSSNALAKKAVSMGLDFKKIARETQHAMKQKKKSNAVSNAVRP